MPYILHFNEIAGDGEYIVITDEDNTPKTQEEFSTPGYEFFQAYEIEVTGTLPTERILIAK